MAMFGVSQEKEDALQERMNKLGIKSDDLVEKFVRSGGHGGQNVNKEATAVELRVGRLPACEGDAVLTNQVFSNLLDNALKYLEPHRRAKITVRGGFYAREIARLAVEQAETVVMPV